jgi:DNA-binding transcriptional regulator YbjK
MTFTNSIDIPPIPVGPEATARQAVLLSEKVATAGSRQHATTEAVTAIMNAGPGDPPSELKRLRLLYQHAYTEEELEQLVENTFQALGIADPDDGDGE